MTDREDIITRQLAYCQHYEPRELECQAGINYDDQFPSKPSACWTGKDKTDENQLARCPKWLRRTRAQGEARADQVEQFIKRHTIAGPVVSAWRKKLPIGKAEVIECPVCEGRLHLSQAASNGHIHSKCETEGCLAWME